MAKYKRKESESFVEESRAAYYIEGSAAIPLYDLTSIQKMKIIRGGVSKSFLEKLKKSSGLDYESLAEALSVTRATLINKKGSQKFSHKISEQIVSLAELYTFGYEVFEDKENFNHWMLAPNQALGGQRPLDIADNFYGRQEIRNIIGRIAYGVYS